MKVLIFLCFDLIITVSIELFNCLKEVYKVFRKHYIDDSSKHFPDYQ